MLSQEHAMTECKTGLVHSTESFGSADGPGVRFLIFLKGCHMRCQYCHNPDTWATAGAEEMSVKQLLDKALRYKSYWGKNGGITVSGGEALLQIKFLTELFTQAKKKGIHTCVDTSGNPFTREEPFFSEFQKLLSVTDLFLLDIKHMDEKKHKELTGQGNANILDMARYLSEQKKAMWIRHVLVPKITDDEQDLKKLKEFVDSLATVERFELLPYHTMGVFKWKELGISYPLEGVQPPTTEQMQRARSLLGIE